MPLSPWSRRSLLLAPLALRAQSWKTLFDGHSTAGWIPVAGGGFPSGCWTVNDGCLHSLVQKPTFQDIRTAREFGDFELVFEWKIAHAGNGGVKYLINKYDSWTPPGSSSPHARARGLEYQLADDANSPDARRGPAHGTASLYSKIAPTNPPLRPAGEWNESKIHLLRPQLQHWLNGQLVLSTTLTGPLPASSAIALQNHSSECWFRSLRIRELA